MYWKTSKYHPATISYSVRKNCILKFILKFNQENVSTLISYQHYSSLDKVTHVLF